MQNILFVCLGNICRSPMAEFVFRHKIARAGLSDRIATASAGTSGYHDGEDMDRRTAAVLKSRGIEPAGFASSRVTAADAGKYDLFIVMDDGNLAALKTIINVPDGRIAKLTDFIPQSGYNIVPDPYYSGDFEETFRLVDAGTDILLEKLKASSGTQS
ncbi:MAG: low molecular weight protein-tyrosine-phosphatase [Neisseria sp.]|uniref:low molecular weight protein-tyrosine-phosphatase n=1 Tax=Neisseria sp. TaxID=192066 RepID=UPI0026DDBD6A|nr:low molecular weight protein-tyrosine-phosphatase [Neisseria sp.]MDO4248315.1 low molecular weight protein-tyrosine-phosphatase [Neisseria sp.]